MDVNNILNNLTSNKTIIIAIIIIVIIICIYYFMDDSSPDKNTDTYQDEQELIEEFENSKKKKSKVHFEEEQEQNQEQEKGQEQQHDIDAEQINVNSDTETYIYLTIAIEEQFKETQLGTVIIKLYNNTPITSQNFLSLCQEKKYANNKIHRVIKDFMIQMGDITNNDGTGGYSIYGNKFPDENFINKHYRSGILSMANSGPNTNGSQFFITTVETPHLDGKHVAFGEVVDGMDTVFNVENQITNNNDEPLQHCFIKDCGVYTSI